MTVSDQHIDLIAQLLADDKLVLFAGAGLSRQGRSKGKAIMPLWRELAAEVADRFEENLADYADNVTDLFQAIANRLSRFDLEEQIRSSINDTEFDPGSVHELLATLPWHRIYTTNYDSLLTRALDERNPIVTEKDFELLRRTSEKRPRLIHLHGDLDNPHTLISEDYDTWEEKHPEATQRFMGDALDKTILFIGYSFSDPHFKLGLLPRLQKLRASRGHRSYAWMWKVPPRQAQLLDARYKIEVQSIESDGEWEEALRKLKSVFQSKETSGSSRTGSAKWSAPEAPFRSEREQLRINGYKLFYHRHRRKLSRLGLSRLSGLNSKRIKSLEKVNLSREANEKCFRLSTYEEIRSLEHALDCKGELEVGREDDFLADYLLYYDLHKGNTPSEIIGSVETRYLGDTKAVVFDFGGTLTLPTHKFNTWERIWKEAGYSVREAGELHRQFIAKTIDHKQWCDLTCEKLRARGFSHESFAKIMSDIEGIPGIDSTFRELDRRGISIHIVSGSIREIINKVVGSSGIFVDNVVSNIFRFDAQGVITEIRGHDFDFQGKSKFVADVAKRRKCSPIEVLFVGNSLNDHYAALSGARTLCVNPKKTDPYDTKIWNNCILEMTDLAEILDYL